MSKPPAITPAGIMTLLFIRATAGFELVIGKTTSVVAGDAMVTVANDPPVPVTEVGFKVRVAGGGTGVKVICDCALAPFQVPVIVAVVLVVTALVGMEAEAEKSPGKTVTVEGGLAAGELLERLTTAPPAGAWPFSITITPASAPPLMVLGVKIDFKDGGSTLNWTAAAPALRVAVSVTGAGEITCPAWIMNCIQAMLPCIVTVGGTGNAVGFELVRVMAAPPAGAAPESCKKTMLESPLKSGLVASEIDTGLGGAELTVNVPVADHAVTAAVVGEASP
jgi:hypothetical protein